MLISRRHFLTYCTGSAAALGLTGLDLKALAAALRDPDGPDVVWLQGSGCNGCSISFLNLIADETPIDAADVLVNLVNLAYHPTLMASAGQTAVDAAYNVDNYILIVEGGVPTAYGGEACTVWTDNGHHVTFQQAVQDFAPAASHVVCVGECSAFGGISAAPPNPTGTVSVSQLTGLTTINVAGCPPHPDWMAWVLARLLIGQPITLDEYGRPLELHSNKVHARCPMRNEPYATQFGQEGMCFLELGCRGKETWADCPERGFNNNVNWCARAGSPCIGCVNHDFPGTEPFFNIGGRSSEPNRARSQNQHRHHRSDSNRNSQP